MKKAIIFFIAIFFVFSVSSIALAATDEELAEAFDKECECQAYEIGMAMTMNFSKNGNATFIDLLKEFKITVPVSQMKEKFPELYLLRKEIKKNASAYVVFIITPKSNEVEVTQIQLLSLAEERGDENDFARVQKEGE